MCSLSKGGFQKFCYLAIIMAFVTNWVAFANPVDVVPAPQVSASLEVQIADIVLEINGQTVDNLRSMYPILFYNDIIYFPITYKYTQALGLQSNWDASKGLSIATNPKGAQKLDQDYLPSDASNQIPGRVVAATTPSFPIVVQGKQAKVQSDWPFFIYNEITYMPATWEYMVTMMGLKVDYAQETRTLSLGGYEVSGNKVTLADISSLPQIFTAAVDAEQKVGLSAQVTVSTTGYGGQLLADTLDFSYDGIIDATTKQMLYTLTPDHATATRLKLDSLQMYTRPDAKDANKMQLFSKENNVWKLSTATSPLTPDLFIGQALRKEDVNTQAEILDKMGLSVLASALRDSSANLFYSLYKNFTLEKPSDEVILAYRGSLRDLLADFGVNETNMSKLYGYVLSIEGLTGGMVSEQQGLQISSLLNNSELSLRSAFDFTSGRLLYQTLDLVLKLSPSDTIANVSMDVTYNYNPALNWPTVD